MSEIESQPTTAAEFISTFEDLAASRRRWIDEVLRSWCLRATKKQLRQASLEWLDIAGRVDVNATLWTWAWERFPILTHPEMAGVNETCQVRLQLNNGDIYEGYPDSRRSLHGDLFLIGRNSLTEDAEELGPFSIDDVATVDRFD